MAKLMNFQSIWTKKATEQMQLHPTAKEYSPLLVLSFIGKLITMLLSVSGGILYFADIFNDIYLPLVIFLSGVLLLLLEGLNLFSLGKALKMGLRAKPIPSALLGLFSLVLFGVSFFITTEGVRQWKAKNTTKETAIAKDFSTERQAIKKDYSLRINRLHTAAEPLKKYTWKSKEVALYNFKIDSLEKVLASQLSNLTQKEHLAQKSDKAKTESKAETFYLLGVVLMAAQLLFNVLLSVLYNRIYIENNQTKKIDEELAQLRETRLANFYSQIKTDFSDLENLFLERLSLSSVAAQEVREPKKTLIDLPQEIVIPKVNSTIGFRVVNPNEKRTNDNRTNDNRDYPNITENNNVATRVCAYCGTPYVHKHNRQKYCSTTCRAKNWEEKTGKKLRI